MSRERVFWFHFNRPASAQAGKPQISIHYLDSCHIVDNIVCVVPVAGRIRKTQPRWVVAGLVDPALFSIVEGVAYIGGTP